jgi:ribosomal protein S24E
MTARREANNRENSSSSLSSHEIAHEKWVTPTKQKLNKRIFEHLGTGDHTQVANLIVTKMGNDLKYIGRRIRIHVYCGKDIGTAS